MNTKTQRVALIGLLAAAALVFGWIECLIPINAAVPGIKLGLGNIAVVFALYRLGWRDALVLSAVKVLLSSLLFGSITGIIYSLFGAAASFCVMMLLYKFRNIGSAGVSAAGGAAHVTAQLAAAALLTSTAEVWRFLPVLLAVGGVSGMVTGGAAALVLKRTERKMIG